MEIEVRVKVKNLKKIEKILKKIKAKKTGKYIEEDVYFGSIELYKRLGYSFLLRVRKKTNLLRVRKKTTKYFLTFKSAKFKKDGIWEEFERDISEPNFFINLLKSMGLELIIKVYKKRTSFILNKIKINLDKFIYPFKENFVELEIISNSQKDKQKLIDLFKKFNIKTKKIIEKGYITLFLEKLKSPFSRYIKY